MFQINRKLMKNNIIYPLLITIFCGLLLSCSEDSSSDMASPSGTGKGGSMARFTVAGEHLYVVDHRNLHIYNVSDPATPTKIKEVTLGVNIETIFPYQEKLFIGSQDGMHIYSLAEPESPVHLSTYRHVTSCDPVVVQDNLAYVTLRTGNNCFRGRNQLDIIDISNPTNPQLIRTYPMTNPFGLGIDGNTLFICEGEHGLKVFNVEDPENIVEIDGRPNLHSFDVIPSNQNLILTGNDGVFQYNYADPEDLTLNSQLSSKNCF